MSSQKGSAITALVVILVLSVALLAGSNFNTIRNWFVVKLTNVSLSLTALIPTQTLTPPPSPSVTNLRYLRARTPFSNSWVAWREIKAFDTNGVKLTPVSCSASSTYSSNTCNRVFDGNTFSLWNSSNFNGWILLDYGSTHSVSKITVLTENTPNPANATHILEASNDGSNFYSITQFNPPISSNTLYAYIPTSTTPGSTPAVSPSPAPASETKIEIRASYGTYAGRAYPTMELRAGDRLLQQWTVTDRPQNYTFSTSGPLGGNLRVYFTNDYYKPPEDRNLIVESITVNGQIFPSSAPNVYSTGTWTTYNGCAAGYKQSNTLHCNGYFEYPTQSFPSPTSTLISTPTPTPTSVPTQNNYLQKQALVFQIDQGFGNGIIQNQDSVGLQRVIDTLKVFQSKYEVYVTLAPRQTDKTKLNWALNLLSQNNIPFVLEVYASDALTLGKDSVNNPFDVQHGRAMTVGELQQYKNKYGQSFAGVRGLEIFAENFTVLACQKLGVNWCDSFKQNLPADNFYQKTFLEDYIKFAKNNGMFALFSDFYWSVYHPWDFDQNTVKQNQNEQDLKDLVKAYPNTVVVMFANNEPSEESRKKIDTWQSVVQPYVQLGAKGFGLSDQSWMCANETTCPSDEIADWAIKAFNKGALVVQTEPVWYWWNFPKGALGQQSSNYTADSQWINRGYATSNLQLWASKLGLTLPSQPVILTNNASCVSIQTPDFIKPSTAFTGKVTVKNIGTTTWQQNSSTNPNPYRLGATDFALPPYTSSIWGQTKIELPAVSVSPGQTVSFTVDTIAPDTVGSYDFGWRMLHDYREWFGDVCTKKIEVSVKPPPPTNATAICPAPGTNATISWATLLGYNSFFVRVKKLPHPTDGSAIFWNDNYTGISYNFSSVPGQAYNWWVHTRDPVTNNASDAIGTTFTCSTQ